MTNTWYSSSWHWLPWLGAFKVHWTSIVRLNVISWSRNNIICLSEQTGRPLRFSTYLINFSEIVSAVRQRHTGSQLWKSHPVVITLPLTVTSPCCQMHWAETSKTHHHCLSPSCLTFSHKSIHSAGSWRHHLCSHYIINSISFGESNCATQCVHVQLWFTHIFLIKATTFNKLSETNLTFARLGWQSGRIKKNANVLQEIIEWMQDYQSPYIV